MAVYLEYWKKHINSISDAIGRSREKEIILSMKDLRIFRPKRKDFNFRIEIREGKLTIANSVPGRDLITILKKTSEILAILKVSRGFIRMDLNLDLHISLIPSTANDITNETRIARLCWNTNGWVLPSGLHGKSKDPVSHEARFGFGHEEWLFALDKIINGYHYGFLEPVRKQQDAFLDKKYDIWLYSINGVTNKRFWIGMLKNVTVIGRSEAQQVKEKYHNEGWLADMKQQAAVSGARPTEFPNSIGIDIFNVKFRPIDIELNDPYYELPSNHPVYQQSRYVFGKYQPGFAIQEQNEDDDFVLIPGTGGDETGDESAKTKKYILEPKTVEIVELHKAMQRKLVKLLVKKHGKRNVANENPAGYGGNKIDIVVKENGGFTFYEIKTFPILKKSIREAMGQIMEYAFWPDKNKANKLVILTQPHGNIEKAKRYVKHLRDTYKIPIYYQHYDYLTDELSELY